MKKLASFTLEELLVVLVIIGILILLAFPNLMPLITKAKSTEAKLQLEHVYTLEKSYFYVNSKYSNNLDDIDFVQEPLILDNGRANYHIEIIEATNSSFIAQAKSVVDFDNDGVFNIWEINEKNELKEIQKD
ncbi:MAG: hypothetical protein WC179_08290 [Candidatus Cloacimonadaceae bacterium]|jgi:type IV pilus assembly protein PilE|nr:hypothetical protein [Bacteroidales bacterium]